MQLLCISINLSDFLKLYESQSKWSLWVHLQKTSNQYDVWTPLLLFLKIQISRTCHFFVHSIILSFSR